MKASPFERARPGDQGPDAILTPRGAMYACKTAIAHMHCVGRPGLREHGIRAVPRAAHIKPDVAWIATR